MFQKHICPPWCKFQVYLICRSKTCPKQGIKIYKKDNTLGSKEWFDLGLWRCYLKLNSDHLLIGCNPWTKYGIDLVKGSKDIERRTQWGEKSDLTLTFEHVTWKSKEIIYSLGATPALIYWRGQKSWVDNTWNTDRTTDSCKTICPLFQGRHKNK